MSDETGRDETTSVDADVAAAIVAAVILHRASVEEEVHLLEEGRSDEGFWGRASRAGSSSALMRKARRG